MLVFGTRPEAIKMAPLIHKLKEKDNDFDVKICLTSQHRHMLDQVLNFFEIKSDIDLNLMKPNQDLFNLTSSILLGMRSVFSKHNPDLVLVHGDTTTTFATALAGYYASVQIGHVEAGLRTYDLQAPFPEEFNRQITSKLCNWHFAPTELSQKNLIAEGILKSKISITGNTVIDSLFWVLKRIEIDKNRQDKLHRNLDNILPFNWQKNNFVLITAHRRENFGHSFLQICKAVYQLALSYPKLNFVYPVHLNPNVIKPVHEILSDAKNVHLIKPQDYEPFIFLLKHSLLVLTDSGGVQEEAPSLGKPVLVMRQITERPEAVKAGTVKLVGSDYQRIVKGVTELLNNEAKYNSMSKAHNPYGDGFASERIVEVLQKIK